MRYALSTLILLLLIVNGLAMPDIHGEGIDKISVYIAYDPYENIGIIEYNVTFDTILNNTIIDIELFADNITLIINVTDENGDILSYTYNMENHTISVLANQTRMISITYMVTNLFDEIGPGLFSALLDLTMYSDIDTTVEIALPGTYNVSIEPENATIKYVNGLTDIILYQPTLYVITIWVSPTTTIPTPTTTVSTTPTTTPTTTQTSTPTTTPSTTPKPEEGAPIWLIVLIVLVVIIAIVAVIVKKK
ncbi:MAG: hypothetical protein B6U89_06310 [Desulfurococcales archaeon ex4484_58]|nr:MAG: hypothetical protein B6U89_06310 [Desulfurococcales archaeon ex4484_58]